jgi:hypothetical protein
MQYVKKDMETHRSLCWALWCTYRSAGYIAFLCKYSTLQYCTISCFDPRYGDFSDTLYIKFVLIVTT